MEYLKTCFKEKNLLYYFAFIFIFYIILSDLMIMRAHLYVSLLVAAVIAYYSTRYAREKKFFD
jgi:multisubunit Na+/H+ antiporter MnhE subunit